MFSSGSGFAADFTRFLADPDFSVVQENGRPKLLEGGTDEKYWARDAHGRRYKLRLKNAAPIYAEIGFSVLAEAAGLPNAPVYPVLLQRGRQGLPTAAAAQALEPGHGKLGLAGARGEWFPGSLQPMAKLETFDPKKLSGKQWAELTGNLLLNYVLGNNDVQLGNGRTGNVGFNGEHFLTLDSTQAFKFYPEEARAGQVAGRYLGLMETGGWKSLSAVEAQAFVEELNRFVSRLERLSPEEIRQVFEPYYRSNDSFRRFKQLPEFDYHAELLRRIRTLRDETTAFLKARGVPEPVVARLKKPAAVAPPAIRLPRAALTVEHVPKLADGAPVDHLWSLYFQDFWKARSAGQEALAAELGKPAEQVIPELLAAAAKDQSRIYEVSPHLRPEFRAPETDTVPQVHLNPANKETLVVVPRNDAEALEIERIARASGARVLALDGAEYGHGAKLDAELFRRIKETVARDKIRKVAIVELPEGTPGLEAALRSSGVELVTIDHHSYAGLDRSHARSSLEQAADLLGYKLSPTGKAIAVNDRAFIYGLKDLGVEKSSIEQLVTDPARLSRLGPIEEFQTARGKLYVLRDSRGTISETALALAIRDYPAMPNVLLVNRGDFRFSGSPEIVRKLQELGRGYESVAGAHFSGGDAARSMFWGLKGLPPEKAAEAEKAISQRIQSVLQVALPEPPRPAPREPKRLAEILAIEDGPERVRALQGVDWRALTEEERLMLLARAGQADNSYEIGELLRLADASEDPRWLPILERWRAEWSGVSRGWQTFLLRNAVSAANRINAAQAATQCVGSALERLAR